MRITGTIRPYSAGTDIYAVPGHNGNLNFGYQYEHGGAGQGWSSFATLDSTRNDGSPSVRWDPARETDSRVIDAIYFNENAPTTLLYMAIQPQGATGPDTTPPSVTITAEPGNPSNTTSPSFSFSGSDNVTPANQLTYQCALDGAAAATCSSPAVESNLAAGGHTFSVQATDQAGNVSTAATYSWVIDTTPPSAPGSVTATAASPRQVNLNWSAATDASGISGYQISRNGSPLATLGNVTSYTDTTAAPNSSYTYTARAIDNAGNTGPSSNASTVTTPAPPSDNTPPSIPANLRSTAVSTSSVSLAWDASTDNSGGSGMAGYRIYRNSILVGSTSQTAFTDSGLTAATTYSYTVSAVDNATNESAQSSALVVKTGSTSGGQVLLGNQAVMGGNDSNSVGQAEAFRVTATASGSAVTAELYVTSGTSLDIGLYASNGAHPGSLLNQATITGLTPNAWNKVTVPATAVTAGTTYWVAILAPSGASTLGFRDQASSGASETSAAGSLTTLPATWTTGNTYADGSLSAYWTS
jgi:chitodextrinase